MNIAGIGFDNTKSIRDDAKYYHIPPTPAGNEVIDESLIGREFTSDGKGVYRAGVKFTIESAYMQNGFAYYKDDADKVHRTKDLPL